MITTHSARRLPAVEPTTRSVAAIIVATILASAVNTTVASTQASDSAASAFRATLRPLPLREVLDSVRRHHPLVEAARARVRAARGSRTTAGTLGNPMLAFQVENAPLPGHAPPAMDREAMTTAMLPLEPLYQRRTRVRRADAELRAAEADAAVASQRVALDAAHAYYRTALLQVGVDVARDLSAWLDTVVAYNRSRVEEGVAAEADLMRSELERDRAGADASMQEADLARARAELAAFLGAFPSGAAVDRQARRVEIEDVPLAMPATLGAAENRPSQSSSIARAELMDRALLERPQLRAARERLTATAASVATERAMLFRQLGAMVGTKQSAGTTSLIAGVSVPLPLFDQNRGEVARATADREAAMLELAAEERAARAEIAGASEAARLLTARATMLAMASSGAGPAYLKRADEARRIALGAYREGAVPLLSVIDAARTWGDARLAYYRTIFAQHESILALLAAEGAELATALDELPAGARR